MKKKIDIFNPRETYKQLMKKPIVVNKDANLIEVSEKMFKNKNTRSVYVVDEYNKLIGTILLRDILKFLSIKFSIFFGESYSFLDIEAKKYISAKNSEDIMRKPIYISENENLLTALSRMEDYYLCDLPIVDEEQRLLGELNGTELLLFVKKLLEERL